MAKEKMSIKKKASAVVAGALAVALAVGGAYAWTDYSQSARNTFNGTAVNGVLLHDDFDGTNKDVYVENTGDSAVYVRVKFAEYLQIGNNSVLTSPASINDGTNEGLDLDGDSTVDTEYIGVTKAQSDNVATWPVHQFINVDGNIDAGNAKSAHSYFEWEMTGRNKQYLAGVTEADGNGFGGLSEEAFNALPDDQEITIGDITTEKKWTLQTEAVMLLSDWLALDAASRPTNACWLLDTDGWAYWSAALQPGTATNLLLDEVLRVENSAPYDNWEYNIDVQLQAVTTNDLDAWFRNGNDVDVAPSDNSKSTTTLTGFELLEHWNGGPITTADGSFLGADGNTYKSVGNNIYRNIDTDDLLLAGQDGKPGNVADDDNDDNVLAGRSKNNNGGLEAGIAVTNIDADKLTYEIANGKANVIVTAGIDKKLGTYDDVIISKDSTTPVLGTYEINGESSTKELVGWNYLGGPLAKMLVATEYVLDNVTPFGTDSDYRNSNLMNEIERIGGDISVDPAYLNVGNVDVDMDLSVGNSIYVCTDKTHQHSGTNCATTYGFTSYYTDATDFTQLTGKTFFALSINEVLAAYGDSHTDGDILASRRVQAAPAYVHPLVNNGGNYNGQNYNWNNSGYKDGNNNTITTTNYWLRSPGYASDRAALVHNDGAVSAHHFVTSTSLGARPACYLNLGS